MAWVIKCRFLSLIIGGYVGTEFFTMVYESTGLPIVLCICGVVSLIGGICTILLIDLPYTGKTPFDPLYGLSGTRWLPLPQALDDHVADDDDGVVGHHLTEEDGDGEETGTSSNSENSWEREGGKEMA